jgi:hypothetical protein
MNKIKRGSKKKAMLPCGGDNNSVSIPQLRFF